MLVKGEDFAAQNKIENGKLLGTMYPNSLTQVQPLI